MQGSTSASTSALPVSSTAMNGNKKSPLLALLEDDSQATLIKQGAEAKVYKIKSLFTLSTSSSSDSASSTPPLLLKYRFPKAYRHSTLDITLTKTRISHEVKCLAKCLKAGVDVPVVKGVDAKSGIILMEWIDGLGSVREVLGGLPEEEDTEEESEEQCLAREQELEERLRRVTLDEDAITRSIGQSIARMHKTDVIHGDLTTSNMLLRSSLAIVLIDFGLSYTSTLIEDKAVDLYVLERAIGSTHPEPEDRKREDTLVERILRAYAEELGDQEWKKVERRLKDVRLRGRKRSMVG